MKREGDQILGGLFSFGLFKKKDVNDQEEVVTERQVDHEKDSNEQRIVEKKKPYRFPPIELLSETKRDCLSDLDLHKEALLIHQVLEAHGYNYAIREVYVGPRFIQYEGYPRNIAKTSKVKTLGRELDYALATSGTEIIVPIPGKSAIGILVSRTKIADVTLRNLIPSRLIQRGKTPELKIRIGKGIIGRNVSVNLNEDAHILIGGTTGSGKSMCLYSIIFYLIYRNTPDMVQFVLINPKKTEFSGFDVIPHTALPVATNEDSIRRSISWLTEELNRRFKLLAEAGCRNVQELRKTRDDSCVPEIIAIVDDVYDLLTGYYWAPDAIQHLVQQARVVGIHLIISTQRPSVDVTAGLLKSCITCRIAFKVASKIDSRIILDETGAENLAPKGEMLIRKQGEASLIRAQGACVSDREIFNVLNFFRGS